MAPSSGRATKPSMPPSMSRRSSSSSQPRPPVAPSTPIPPRDDPFCSSGMGLLMPPSCSDDAPGDSRVVGDDQDDPSWEPHGEGGGIGSFSFSDSSSSDGDGDDDASAASTATRDDDVDDGTDDDALTFQTLDDESDYQTKLVFRKYHGPVADLGAPGAAAPITPEYPKPPNAKSAAAAGDDPVSLQAPPGGGQGIRFYPFWLRPSAAPGTTPRTKNNGSPSSTAVPVVVVAAAAPPPEAAAPAPATPNQINEVDDDDDSGVACFPRFEAPTCGGNCQNLPAADDDESSSGGRGGDKDPTSVVPPPPMAGNDDADVVEDDSATAPIEGPTAALPEDELTADLSTLPSSYSSNNNVDGGTAGSERGASSSSMNLHDRLALAADAIDQTVEAVLGLCVPEKPLCAVVRGKSVMCVPPENPTACFGGDWAEASVSENPKVCFGNWSETEAQLSERESPTPLALVEDEDEEPRLRWRPDDDNAPAAEGWATFPPKVEVTPQDDDDFSCHNGVGDNHSSIHRNTKMIVSSTTDERDDTRVVTIVGMDEVLHRHRRKRRGNGSEKRPGRFGRWLLRGSAAKSLQETQEGGSQIASMRQRSLFSSRSLDGSASRPHTRRRTAKHRREPWFRRLVTLRGASSLVHNENPGSRTGNGGDNEDDGGRSFRSHSTLSSKFGGEESVVLDWPVPRASSFVVANTNANANTNETYNDNEYDYGCHDQACRIALQDIDVYSYCSVTSSLGSHESGAPFLSASWLWALLPIRELRILSRAVGIDTYSDEEENDDMNKGGNEVGGKLATDPRNKGGMPVEEERDGAVPDVQKFAPIHVRKGKTHWEEAPPSPPLSTITMLTLPHRQNSLMVEEPREDSESPSQPSVPARLDEPAADGGGEWLWNPTGSFVTEDERTVTDGDSSIHTIRLLRVPAQPATPSQAPLPLTPPRTTTRPSRSKRAVYAMTYLKPKALDVPATPLSWQPGLSARMSHRDGPPGSAESPRSVFSFKTKALADDLSQHEESQSPSLSTASLRPSVAHGGSPDDHGTSPPTRSPPKRTRRRPYSFRSESARPSSPLAGAAPSSPRPASPRSPKRSSGDRAPLLPKDVSSSVASASSSRSPTYATHDETTTFASASFDDDNASQQQRQQQGFVTTTLKIRRVPTYEGRSSPSPSS